MKEEQPSLGQLIWLVRRELEWAYEADADHPLRFEVGPVELDVTVEATRATTGGGGLDLKVLGVGASGELSREKQAGDDLAGACDVDAGGHADGEPQVSDFGAGYRAAAAASGRGRRDGCRVSAACGARGHGRRSGVGGGGY